VPTKSILGIAPGPGDPAYAVPADWMIVGAMNVQ
jgi:hypothetical protein